MQDRIKKRGVQFLSYKEQKIVIQLTSEGKKKYAALRYLRPTHSGVQDNIYTFYCTLNQAEFYFLKFGSDAEILEPAELRERFATAYRTAHMLYNDDTE